MRRVLTIALSLGVLLLVSACGGAGSQAGSSSSSTVSPPSDQSTGADTPADEWKAVEDAAKQEGSVTIYTSIPETAISAACKAFQQRYDIGCEYYRAQTFAVLEKYQQEENAGQNQADVMSLGDPSEMTTLSKGSKLVEWIPPEAENVDKRFVYPDYFSVAMYVATIAYNSDQVSEDVAPKDWPDVLKPEWKGKVGVMDPSAGSTIVTWYHVMNQLYGKPFFEQLATQQPRLFNAGQPLTDGLTSGELAVTAWHYSYQALAAQAKNAPIGIVYPQKTWAYERVAGVLKSANHPNAAKLFVNFLLTPEGQVAHNTPMTNMTIRSDAKIPGVPTLEEIGSEFVTYDPAEIAEKREMYQKEFDALFKR